MLQLQVAANLQDNTCSPVCVLVYLGLTTIPTRENDGPLEGGQVTNNRGKGSNPFSMLLRHVALDSSNIHTPLTTERAAVLQFFFQLGQLEKIMPVRPLQNRGDVGPLYQGQCNRLFGLG